jgi:hypothetical protein
MLVLGIHTKELCIMSQWEHASSAIYIFKKTNQGWNTWRARSHLYACLIFHILTQYAILLPSLLFLFFYLYLGIH